jgi:hypothetical protein
VAAIADHEVKLAIAIEVTHGDAGRVQASSDCYGSSESTRPIVQKYARGGIAMAGDSEVGLTVPVEIPHCHRADSQSCVVPRPASAAGWPSLISLQSAYINVCETTAERCPTVVSGTIDATLAG